jgi:monoamine oxidase
MADTSKPWVSRRHFLAGVGRAGGTAALYQTMAALGLFASPACAGPPAVQPGSGRGVRVAVLGAGVAGLASALELVKNGYDVTVLEARKRPGGRVFTVRRGSTVEENGSRQEVDWDEDPALYFDAGAARLPQHHQGILGYARALGVPLEVMSNENRGALLQTSKAFGGRPVRNGRVNADVRGYLAELAAKAIDHATLAGPLTEEDKEKLRSFFREFGGLDKDLAYHGSLRAGYEALPGGGPTPGRPSLPLDLAQLVAADFWKLYEFSESPVQVPTMMRPVGGMSKIAEAMARSLGPRIRYGAEITRLQRRPDGAQVEWRDTETRQASALSAEFVVVTLQPGILRALDADFTPRVLQALAAPVETPLAKVAFQATPRFWEVDQQIYGGISWTDHPITQIWYPSQGIHAPKGILVGAYMLTGGDDFGRKSIPDRLELALQGGELLHPGYRKYVGGGVSIAWKNVKHSSGATTRWSEDARRDHYPVLLEPDGPYHFAGEYLSYVNGWQEGAVQSAHYAVEKLADRVRRLEMGQKEEKKT